MIDRAAAEERMARAKVAYTRAAQAALSGLPMASAMAGAALEEVNAARAELQCLETEPLGVIS